jgi:nucleotide-binding universal stress UspA family protein
MNTLTNKSLTEQLGTPERFTDPYMVAVTCAAHANAGAFKIKYILVPTRPSKASIEALKYAGWLANQFGSKIIILHAVASGCSDVNPQEFQGDISRVTGIEPAQIRAILIRQGVDGFMPVITVAQDEQADLIVIPADFYKQPVHFFQTDMMEKLIHHATCPLFIVGDKVQTDPD